jgi:serine/threonine protein kinase
MTSSDRPPVSRFREGEIIAGKYRVERVLGAGGMGMVVAAFHLQLRQRVAIKLLLPEAGRTPETLARFAREGQAAARIQSEHVARVIDVAVLEDGSPYMVMEFLEGQDLAQVLATRGPLPLEEAVGYILEACEGVAEAHAAGIIHRDLKPSNLFVCQRGAGRTIVKVLDFGISKEQPLTPSASDHGLTRTGAVMGSPLYMSPEQMASAKHVDGRTDVWSLGVTLFELLCGKTPFRGESMTELIAAVLQAEPAAVRDLRSELPPAVTSVVARALEKDRSRRYASVGELAAAIAPFGPRHAGVMAERVAHALASGSVPPPAQATERTVSLWPMGAIDSERLAHEATAKAVSVPREGIGVSTTAQPVSSERPKAAGVSVSSPASGRPRLALIGVLAVVAAGFAAAVALRGHKAEGGVTVEPPLASTVTSAAPPLSTASASLTAASVVSTPPVPTETPPTVASSAAQRKASSPPRPPPAVAVQPSAKVSVAPPPAPASSPACRVVQYLDADGETRFRRECP